MKPSLTADDFFNRLRKAAGKLKRIDVSLYRPLFVELFPTLPVPDVRTKLAGWLDQLAENDDIVLPKGQRLYDRSNTGELPAWIQIRHTSVEDAELPIDPESFPWAQELRFACAIRDARQLDILLRVQRFLSNGGRERPVVPAKERSIELFGHEKRLEMLKNGNLFGEGRLSFDLLRCFPVPPYLLYESVSLSSENRPVLVVENQSTYHSFARWNRELRLFCAIVYGCGDAFKTSATGLSNLLPGWNWNGQLFYFGDIDPEGLIIPIAASAALSTLDLPSLKPHTGCYAHLLKQAKLTHLPSTDPIGFPSACRNWLGKGLADEAEHWFERGIRIAQELVGWEQLVRNGSVFSMC